MGSIAMDQVGNIALGYSTSSATTRPSIMFAGRETIDPLNTLSVDNTLKVGGGSQTTGLSRWGDYSTMAVDPVDDCTFWFTSEYLQTNGTFNWSTRVGSFKFSSCSGSGEPPAPSFALSATPSSRSIVQGQSTTFNATVTGLNSYIGGGTFTVTGLPSFATGTFVPPSYSGGAGTSTLTVTTATNTPAGSYPLTIAATDAPNALVQSTIVTLTVSPIPVPDFTVAASPASRTVKRGRSTTYGVTVTPSGGFSETVAFSVTGCPSGSSCVFSPGNVTGGGTSTLTVVTSSSTPRTTYTLGITGASISRTRNATVSLKVQ